MDAAMEDPRRAALARADALLGKRGPLSARECHELADLTPLVPGRSRAVAGKLGAQADAAAVPALLELPRGIAGVVEGLIRAVRNGVARIRHDGSEAPRGLVLLVPRSRARVFPKVLARLAIAFEGAVEVLTVGSRTYYRVAVLEGAGTLAGKVARVARDLEWLVPRALEIEGTELWIHGFRMARGRRDRALGRHFVDAFVRYAATRTEPSGRPAP
ncbi:MAG: hypothetical protein D6705_03505 [Deltaproteobacteria bacterium]|nr:MAG: hypothetical protein D6705_03505 [Deltaproteobacteria bacterium]